MRNKKLPALVAKISAKAGVKEATIRQKASRRASQLGIQTEAALILLARELGIGTVRHMNKLSPEQQAQVRSVQSTTPVQATSSKGSSSSGSAARPASGPSAQALTSAAIALLLEDDELRGRCGDLLKRKKNYDSVFREATTVLEHRLRKLSGLTKAKVKSNEALVAQCLNPPGALLRVSEHDDEQSGFFLLVKGVFLLFRNPHHHQLSDGLSKQDALKICGLIDSILLSLERGKSTS